MNKQAFLAQLQKGLSGLPQDDIEERLMFYREMIDDRMEEGLSEEQAVREIGPADTVISQILADTPLTKLIKEKGKPNRTLKTWEWIFLILGSPIWLSLLIAAFAIVCSIYVTIWSMVVSFWAIAVSFAACALGGILSALFFLLQGHTLTGLGMLSAGFCFAGLSIFLFCGGHATTKGILVLTKKMALGLKTLLIRKENKP